MDGYAGRHAFPLLQCQHLWRIGNRLPHAFDARALPKIQRASCRLSTKKHTTPWWRLNWPNILKLRRRIQTPRNGTAPLRSASGAPIGKQKPKKPPCDWAPNPMAWSPQRPAPRTLQVHSHPFRFLSQDCLSSKTRKHSRPSLPPTLLPMSARIPRPQLLS